MIKNIFINGVQVNNSNIFLSELGNIGSARVEFNDYRRGGVSGQVLSVPQKRGFNISLKFKVIGTSYETYYLNRDRLLGLLENKELGLKTLSFELADGTIKDIDVLFSDPAHGINPQNLLNGEFTVTAVSEKEYLTSREQKTLDLVIKNLGGMAIPTEIPTSIANVPMESETIAINNGNSKGYPVIEIYGSFATGFSLRNETTGEQIDYSDEVLLSDKIVIDCYSMTIIKNDVFNVLQYFDGQRVSLQSGENKISLTGSAGDTGTGKVIFNNYYLNV